MELPILFYDDRDSGSRRRARQPGALARALSLLRFVLAPAPA